MSAMKTTSPWIFLTGLIAVSTLVSIPADARSQDPSRWRNLNAQARKVGAGTSNRNLARVLFRVRRVPGAVGQLRSLYKGAIKAPAGSAGLASYIKVRSDTAGFLNKTLGPAMSTGTSGKPATARFMIAGKYRTSRVTDEVVDPATGKTVMKVYASSKKDVQDAISAAHGARDKTAALTPKARAEILRGVARQLKSRKVELAQVMALEAGKPLADALVEVDRAINTFTLSAKEAMKLKPRTELTPGGKMKITRAPVGVVSAIAPFNFPLNLVAHKVAPAIAAGNPVIIKPSPRTPMTAMLLAQMVNKTAWPKAALSVVTPRVSNIAPLVNDARVKMVSFTGSETIGWKIKRQASGKRVSLELGGNAALVVHKDADLKDAVTKAVRGSFAYSGQICISTQRIMVHEKVYDKFVKEFVKQTKQIKVGDPLMAGTQLGPMINRGAVDRAQAWVKEAVAGGARVLVGGGARGNYMDPTVVVGAKANHKIVKEEAFAPVVVISKYNKLDTALKQVNDSRFGLQAGIFTRSQKVADKAFNRLDVGGLVVNHVPTIRFDAQPYGGIKRSGFGREGPKYAVEDMTELKTMLLPGVR